ncbi:hypothetical protein, partial [Actinomyces israelii]
MRLGRFVATIGATATLAVVGTAVSAPALAAEEDGFVTDGKYTGVADPSSTLTVSGTGCTDPAGHPTSLTWAIGNEDSTAAGTGEVKEDGSWTATIDLAQAVPAAGLKDQQRTGLSFACVDYNTNTLKTLSLSLQLDSSKLSGEYKLINQADGTQTIALDVKGFAPGEEVTFRVAPESAYQSEQGPVEGDFHALGTFNADGGGAVAQSFTPPTDLPDGRYKAGVFGAAYGEHAWFENILVKDGKIYTVDKGDGGQGDGGQGDGDQDNNGGGLPEPTEAAEAPSQTAAPAAGGDPADPPAAGNPA